MWSSELEVLFIFFVVFIILICILNWCCKLIRLVILFIVFILFFLRVFVRIFMLVLVLNWVLGLVVWNKLFMFLNSDWLLRWISLIWFIIFIVLVGVFCGWIEMVLLLLILILFSGIGKVIGVFVLFKIGCLLLLSSSFVLLICKLLLWVSFFLLVLFSIEI